MAYRKVGNIELNQVKLATRGFSGSLFANTILYFKNWSIQDGGLETRAARDLEKFLGLVLSCLDFRDNTKTRLVII